jgi:hypothetical protein
MMSEFNIDQEVTNNSEDDQSRTTLDTSELYEKKLPFLATIVLG